MDNEEFEKYVNERYYPQINWYDKKAISNKKTFEILQSTIIILTIITPIFIVIEITIYHEFAYISLVAAVIIAIITSFQRTFRYRDNWLTYRNICETLKKEIYFYSSNSRDYANSVNPISVFINNVESIISQENDFWTRNIESNKEISSDQ